MGSSSKGGESLKDYGKQKNVEFQAQINEHILPAHVPVEERQAWLCEEATFWLDKTSNVFAYRGWKILSRGAKASWS
jgi:hypothetical protein